MCWEDESVKGEGGSTNILPIMWTVVFTIDKFQEYAWIWTAMEVRLFVVLGYPIGETPIWKCEIWWIMGATKCDIWSLMETTIGGIRLKFGYQISSPTAWGVTVFVRRQLGAGRHIPVVWHYYAPIQINVWVVCCVSSIGQSYVMYY